MDKTSYKYEVIQEVLLMPDNQLDIQTLCSLAGVSRSGYYRWIAAAPFREEKEAQDRKDFERILGAFRFRNYKKGARSIQMRLLHEKPPVQMNLKKIRRLMKKYGLFCPIRKANPYRRMMKAMRTNTVAPNLLDRKFTAGGPRSVLLTDITYIRCGDGFCYLSTILDAYTRQILSYVLSESLEIDFVLETVELLISKHGISLQQSTIVHSDQGSHYTSYKFIRIIQDSELRQSMSRRGNCWDNAPQESFYGHMKDELELSGDETYAEIKAIIDDWMDYYNNDRYQWQLAKLSPNEYYQYCLTGKYPLDIPAPEGSQK